MFSPRFTAYARSQGLAAQQALEADIERYPGGKMTGFILWIRICSSARLAQIRLLAVRTGYKL